MSSHMFVAMAYGSPERVVTVEQCRCVYKLVGQRAS